MINVLCLYLINICLIFFFIFYMLYRLVMAGRTLGSEWVRDRLRKQGRPRIPSFVIRCTTSAPTSTTSTASPFSTRPPLWSRRQGRPWHLGYWRLDMAKWAWPVGSTCQFWRVGLHIWACSKFSNRLTHRLKRGGAGQLTGLSFFFFFKKKERMGVRSVLGQQPKTCT